MKKKTIFRALGVVFVAVIVLAGLRVKTIITKISDENPLISQIKGAKGKPVIISTVKYGDDVKPQYARTYCQLLPFKRYILDDQIYCWTEKLTSEVETNE